MPTIKITKEEQAKLRCEAKDELHRIELVFFNNELITEIDMLKNKFAICEQVYKVILREHQFKKTGIYNVRFLITMKQVPHALHFAGYNYNKELLSKIFGAEERVGKRSVKKLRDALTHGVKQNAIDELIERKEELHGYMDEFLDGIRNSD